MPNLHASAALCAALREDLLRRFPELSEDRETLEDTLSGISDFDRAVETVVNSIADDETMADAIIAGMKAMETRLERYKARVASKRAAVASAMEAADVRKFTFPRATVSLGKAPDKVMVIVESAIPADFWVEQPPPPPKLDKRLLLSALKDGATVPGAVLSNGGAQLSIRTK